jgi:dolichyl-phosphate-mannose--protein O-mannosyl transferase
VDFPHGLSWDEHHFVENARNYIAHRHDWNDHPPLGKLVIVPWILAFGDTSLSWRLSPLAFGMTSILLAHFIGVELFRDRRAGYLAAAFVAGDGFLISFSRTALLDGMLTTLVLASVCATSKARGPLGAILAGALIGLAANVKLSGFALGLPAALVIAARAPRLLSARTLLTLLGLLAAPVAFTAASSLGLYLAREPHGAGDVWANTFKLLTQHYGAQSFTHPLTSHWYTWGLPTRPVTMRYDLAGPQTVRALTTLGNPLLWWSCTIALVVGLFALGTAAVGVVRPKSSRIHLGRETRAAFVLVAFALSMLLPWIIGKRDSYIYHYLPTYGCLLVLVGGVVARAYRQKRIAALGYTAVVFLVTVFYAPVWGQLPIGRAGFEARLFMPGWR